MFFLLAPSALLADQLLAGLAKCEEMKDNTQRLACYDDFVSQLRQQEVVALLERSQPELLPQPAAEVLNSKLHTADSDDQFSLRVSDFLAMIKVAQLDEGGSIKILGWQQLDKSNYILWLQLRGRTGLTFQFYEKSKQHKDAVCVLEAVIMQGQHIDPGMFIMNIAAMGPE